MVYQLYQDPDPEAKSRADQWLQGLQASTEAWTIAWLLLQHQVYTYTPFHVHVCTHLQHVRTCTCTVHALAEMDIPMA